MVKRNILSNRLVLNHEAFAEIPNPAKLCGHDAQEGGKVESKPACVLLGWLPPRSYLFHVPDPPDPSEISRFVETTSPFLEDATDILGPDKRPAEKRDQMGAAQSTQTPPSEQVIRPQGDATVQVRSIPANGINA
jgi:hypothetical protein